MPWSDNSDPGGKPGQKPTPKPGPWGPPPPSGGRSKDQGETTNAQSEAPRRSGPPSPPDDLVALWRRLRQRIEQEFIAARPTLSRKLVPALLGAIVTLWLVSGFYEVQANEDGVITTFGAFSRSVGPGWHYHLPAPFERLRRVPVASLSQTNIGSSDGDPPGESLMLTGDQNIADLTFSVQWRVNDPDKYLFGVRNTDETIRAVGESAMREIVGRSTFADVTAAGKARIEIAAAGLMQSILDRYGAGVTIVSVQIASANPPPKVAPDAQAAQNAAQEAQSAINQANIYAVKAAGDANAAAAQRRQAAEAYRAQATQDAKGQAAAFDTVYQQYRRAPAETRQRLYLETMERVLGKSSKVIVDAHGAGGPLVLPQNPQAAPAPGAQAQPQTSPAQ